METSLLSRLEPELDQAADGFGKRGHIRLLLGPLHNRSPNNGVCSEPHQRSSAAARAAHDFLFNRDCFLHTFCITRKRAEGKLELSLGSNPNHNGVESKWPKLTACISRHPQTRLQSIIP